MQSNLHLLRRAVRTKKASKVRDLCHTSPPGLNDQPTGTLTSSQSRPSQPALSLDEFKLQLRAHDLIATLLDIHIPIQLHGLPQPLLISRPEIQFHSIAPRKRDARRRFINLLEVKRRDDCSTRLIKIRPHALQLFFLVLIALLLGPNERVSCPGRAAGNLEEVVKVQDAAFAAGPAFAAFVEDGGARVVGAVFRVWTWAGGGCCGAGFAFAGGVWGDLGVWVVGVVFGLWWGLWCCRG